MNTCKCGQDLTTTHLCDLLPVPTVTGVPITLNGQPATLGFMSTEYAAGVIANLQASVAALTAERNRLREALDEGKRIIGNFEADAPGCTECDGERYKESNTGEITHRDNCPARPFLMRLASP